jgi:solute carrier family 25 carnitine/acylcarnitine transporter 20/29
VKCLLQIQNNDKLLYNGMIDCVRKIYKENGIRGVYKGFLITMYRELPASGVYLNFCGIPPFHTIKHLLEWCVV